MGMREEVLKLAEECGAQSKAADGTGEPYIIYRGEIVTNLLERFYQAATLQAAERMKEEAANSCRALMPTDEQLKQAEEQRYFSFASVTRWCHDAIRAIDVNKLFGE